MPLPAGAPREGARDVAGEAGAEAQRRRDARRGEARAREQKRERHGRESRRAHEAVPRAVDKPQLVRRAQAAAQPEEHGEVLPVAARPAVAALEKRRARRGEAVGEQAVAHIAAVQQRALHRVVGEDEVFRQVGAALEQGPDVQYALPREAAAAGEVHPDLASGGDVGVDAARPRRRAGEERPLARLELDAYARVDDAAARAHAAEAAVKLRAVERVEHRAYELARRAGQQAGVRVEGEDVFHAAEPGRLAGEDLQLVFPPGAEPCELQKRAALALVPAPDAVARRLPARAEKEIKAAAVFGVQPLDGPARRLDKRAVALKARRGGLGQVAEQPEAQFAAAVARGEAEFLKPRGEGGAVLRLSEDGGDDAERPPLARHALRELHARREPRRQGAQQRGVQRALHERAHGQEGEQRRPNAAGYEAQRGGDKRGQKRERRGPSEARAAPSRPSQRLAE